MALLRHRWVDEPVYTASEHITSIAPAKKEEEDAYKKKMKTMPYRNPTRAVEHHRYRA